MPTSTRKPKLSIQILLVLSILLIGVLVTPYALRATNPNPFDADPVVTTWENAKAAGSYHFSSDVTQVTVPVAKVSNAGLPARNSLNPPACGARR